MATEQVGGVEYYADIDVSGVLKGGKVINRQVDLASAKFTKLDTSVSKTTKSVRRGLGGMGRSAGQAGIQIQQLVGQVQAGTSPFVALSQQAADLGIVLGAPLLGAVAGIGAAIAGTLIPSLFSAGEEVDELREKLKKLEEESGLTANQTRLLAQEDRKAAEEKRARIEQLEEEIRAEERLNEQRRAQRTGVGTAQSPFARPTVQLDTNAAIEKSNELIVRNRAEVDTLNQELGELEKNIARYNEGQQEALRQQQKQRDLLQQLNQESELLRVKNEQGALAAARLSAAYELGLTNAEMLPDEIDAVIQKLFEQEQAEKRAAEAKREKAQAEREAEQEARKAQTTYDRNIEALRKQIEELEGSDAAFKLYADNLRASAVAAGVSTTEIDKLIQRVRTLRQEQEADKEREQVAGAAQGVGLTDLQALEQRYNQEREALLAAQEAGIQSKISYEERLTELQRQYSEERKRIMEGETQNAILNFDSLANRAAGAFASVAVGAQTGTEAIRGLAMSIAQEAIGALIRMGIQAIATNATVSASEQATKATSAATTAAAMATTTATTTAAAASIAAAWTPAATLASIATLGSASGIGVTALASGLAAGQAISAASTATNLAASAAGGLLGGGRLYGGNVAPGKLYPVTEDGRPEVLTQGNKQYLLPGSRGNVTSNRDMGGMMGGATVNIDIVNNAAGMVSVTPSSSERDGQTDIKFIIDAVRNDVLEGGSVYSAIKERTNAGTKTG